jgi:cytochrome c5
MLVPDVTPSISLVHDEKRSPSNGTPKRSTLAIFLALLLPVAHAQPTSTPPTQRSAEQIVRAQCAKCHQAGTGGAPKIGDQAAWIPRLKPGLDTVVRSAIKGHGGMPARGGMADLTDSELRSAITYMFTPAAPPK